MADLNQQYFETKKVHQENYKRRKLTFKKASINLLVFALLLIIFSILNKDCSNKIKQNQLNDQQQLESNR